MIDVDSDKRLAARHHCQLIDQTLYNAFGERQVATIYTPANDYEVILEDDPQFQRTYRRCHRLYVPATRAPQVPLICRRHGSLLGRPAHRQSPGPASRGHAMSFNLAPGVSLGQAVDSDQRRFSAELELPVTLQGGFQGTAQVFQIIARAQGRC